MEYRYDPFHRKQYRNPSPFFSTTAQVPQRPHPAAAQPSVPRRRGVVCIPVVEGNQGRNPQPVKVPRAMRLSDHDAAVRIQQSLRGHLVRRAVASVRALEAEVGHIEARVRESVGRIATDERERVRVGEMVMRVLLRLDGVRGVREYRKKVVRRAVKLQEMIDSLAAGGAGEEEVSPGEEAEEEEQRGGKEAVRGREDTVTSDSLVDAIPVKDEVAGDSSGSSENGAEAIQEEAEAVKDIANDPRDVDGASQALEESTVGVGVDHAVEVSKPDALEETPAASMVVDNHAGEGDASLAQPDTIRETPAAVPLTGERDHDAMGDASAAEIRNGNDEPGAGIGSSVEDAHPEQAEKTFSDYVVVTDPDSPLTDGATTPSDEGRPEPAPAMTGQSASPCLMVPQTPAPGPMEEVVGRVSQENEGLRGMVEQLLQHSALQCRLVCQLTRRVECLEKKVEKMGKKQRKHACHAGAAAAAATGKKN